MGFFNLLFKTEISSNVTRGSIVFIFKLKFLFVNIFRYLFQKNESIWQYECKDQLRFIAFMVFVQSSISAI